MHLYSRSTGAMLSEKKKRKRESNDLFTAMHARDASFLFILEGLVP
jgi:hypothetical protein